MWASFDRARLEFRFHSPHITFCDGRGKESTSTIEGMVGAELVEGKIEVRQEGELVAAGEKLVFTPVQQSQSGFEISDVLIGIGFHWEQKEDQHFPGKLKLMIRGREDSGH